MKEDQSAGLTPERKWIVETHHGASLLSLDFKSQSTPDTGFLKLLLLCGVQGRSPFVKRALLVWKEAGKLKRQTGWDASSVPEQMSGGPSDGSCMHQGACADRLCPVEPGAASALVRGEQLGFLVTIFSHSLWEVVFQWILKDQNQYSFL